MSSRRTRLRCRWRIKANRGASVLKMKAGQKTGMGIHEAGCFLAFAFGPVTACQTGQIYLGATDQVWRPWRLRYRGN